jgi:type III pantothenate kinase
MNLTIDIGNTRAKIYVFDTENSIVFEYISKELTVEILQNICTKYHVTHSISIASGSMEMTVAAYLEIKENHIFFDHTVAIPILNNYKTPETLGKDRLAAVIGAQALFPQTNILVMDAGTCTTYNLLVENTFLGGNITPGLLMRSEAMHHFTDKLPKVDFTLYIPEIGIDTISSLQSGAFYGAYLEMKQWIEYYKMNNNIDKIVITGGNAHFFESKFDKNILIIEQDIVAIGLNHIINFNFA